MRVFILFGLTLIVSASAVLEVRSNYHESVGIPNAEKIRIYEEEIYVKNAQEEIWENRIIGGVIAPANAHPHFAGLLINLFGTNSRSVCGSSLVSPNRLVTAAHCWYDGVNQAWQFEVVLGSNFLYSGGERILTNHVIMHPQYFFPLLTNDVAMIYLPRPAFIDNRTVKPIRLPMGSELWNQFENDWAVAAGFGKTSDQQQAASTIVSHVNLQVMNLARCQATFVAGYVTASTLCTSGVGGVGVCGGDSGGPLAAYGSDGEPFLIGISSFAAYNACENGHPSGFARVTSFHGFISQHM